MIDSSSRGVRQSVADQDDRAIDCIEIEQPGDRRHFGVHVSLLLLVIAATWSLLAIGRWLVPLVPGVWSSTTFIDTQLKYQLLTLVLASLVCGVLVLVRPTVARLYGRRGELGAAAEANRLFGIRAGESWRSVGRTFLIIVTLVTSVVIWLQVVRGQELRWSWHVLIFVPVLAAVNAAVEEYMTRYGVIVALHGYLSQRVIAIISGVVFGTVHYFGTPGGFVGVIVAGVLGWLLARSVLETRGMFWAWLIHFVQDLVILTALLMTAAL